MSDKDNLRIVKYCEYDSCKFQYKTPHYHYDEHTMNFTGKITCDYSISKMSRYELIKKLIE